MENMKDRLAYFRNQLKMTTRKFGERIGITGGAVTNMEKGQRNITERTITDICREFNVSENWLRTGEGEMLAPISTAFEQLAKEYNMSELEQHLIKEFLFLGREERNVISKYIKNVFEKISEESKANENMVSLKLTGRNGTKEIKMTESQAEKFIEEIENGIDSTDDKSLF